MTIPKVIAHRGGRKWAPENTMAAFRKCLDLKIDGIELDIQRCASGELVVIHDEDLKRTTNGKGLVKEKTLEELKSLSAGAWFSPEFESEKIPTLQEVLDLVKGKMIVNIEIKNAPVEYPGIEDDLLNVIGSYKWTDRLIVSSFDHRVVRRVHSKSAGLPLALLAVGIFSGLDQYASHIGATIWHPNIHELLEDAVAEAHQLKMSVNPWTVNGEHDWQRALDLGVDGVVTDDPAGLVRFLAARQSKGAASSVRT